MTDLPQPSRSAPSSGHIVCNGCDGRGFLRAGNFAERTFPRCKDCDGIGQKYLDAKDTN